VRDLDAARQEIVVWGGDGARLWSSDDCANPSSADQRTLVPGRPVAFAVTVGRPQVDAGLRVGPDRRPCGRISRAHARRRHHQRAGAVPAFAVRARGSL